MVVIAAYECKLSTKVKRAALDYKAWLEGQGEQVELRMSREKDCFLPIWEVWTKQGDTDVKT